MIHKNGIKKYKIPGTNIPVNNQVGLDQRGNTLSGGLGGNTSTHSPRLVDYPPDQACHGSLPCPHIALRERPLFSSSNKCYPRPSPLNMGASSLIIRCSNHLISHEKMGTDGKKALMATTYGRGTWILIGPSTQALYWTARSMRSK